MDLNAATLLMRADASAASGMGHIGRCTALAAAWCEQGGRAVLAASGPQQALLNMAGPLPLVWLGEARPDLAADLAATLQAASVWHANLVLIDSYSHDRAFESALRSALPLIAVDDLASRRHDCDLLIDTSAGSGDHGLYCGLVGDDTVLLLGTDYIVLRQPFPAFDFAARSGTGIARLLVSFGGTDPMGHSGLALDAVASCAAICPSVDLVLTSANPALAVLQKRAAALPGVTLHVDTNEMAALMARAGLAFGSGGSTSWERCRAGLPALVTISADNQLGVAKMLEGAGIIRIVQPANAASIAEALARALADHAWRASASRAGMALVDGKGGGRLVAAIQSHLAARLSPGG